MLPFDAPGFAGRESRLVSAPRPPLSIAVRSRIPSVTAILPREARAHSFSRPILQRAASSLLAMQLVDKNPEVTTKPVSRRGSITLPFVSLVLGMIALDFALGSSASAAPLFVCLVIWVAWTDSFRRACVLGIFLCAAHLARGWIIGAPVPFGMQVVNGVIRGLTLVVLAFFTSKAAWRFRAMHSRIQALEHHLTICGKCGLLRVDDGSWVPVEVAEHSGGRTGVLCPECERRSYEI